MSNPGVQALSGAIIEMFKRTAASGGSSRSGKSGKPAASGTRAPRPLPPRAPESSDEEVDGGFPPPPADIPHPFQTQHQYTYRDPEQFNATFSIVTSTQQTAMAREVSQGVELKVKTLDEALAAMDLQDPDAEAEPAERRGRRQQPQRFAVPGQGYLFSCPSEVPVPIKFAQRRKRWDFGTRVSVPEEPPVAIDFSRLLKLGSGTFGTVYKIGDLAAKFLEARTDGAQNYVCEEAMLLSRISHPNINSFIRAFVFEEAGSRAAAVLTFTELASMSLFDLISQPRWQDSGSGAMRRYHRPRFERHTLEGLKHLHSLGVVHKDIKTENVLIFVSENHLVAKLADVGCAVRGVCADRSGTPCYQAPETLALGINSSAGDMWSWGGLLWELNTGEEEPPVDYQNVFKVLGGYRDPELNLLAERRGCIHRNHFPHKPADGALEDAILSKGHALPPAVLVMLKRLFRLNPADRPTAAQLLRYARYSDPDQMLGVSLPDPRLEAEAPGSVELVSIPQLELSGVIERVPLAEDVMESRANWGAVPVTRAGEFVPGELFFKHKIRNNQRLMGAKRAVKLTDEMLTRVRFSPDGLSAMHSEWWYRWEDKLVILYVLHGSAISPGAVERVMVEGMRLSKEDPHIAPIFHYTVGTVGDFVYGAVVTEALESLGTVSWSALGAKSRVRNSLIIAKQLARLLHSLRVTHSQKIYLRPDILQPRNFLVSEGSAEDAFRFNVITAVLDDPLREAPPSTLATALGAPEKPLLGVYRDAILQNMCTGVSADDDTFKGALKGPLSNPETLKPLNLPRQTISDEFIDTRFNFIRIDPPPFLLAQTQVAADGCAQ
uniref:Non-structural kinase n=1 Tax=Latid herpesvirus 1 TaxID=3096545 RepID=A0AB33V6L9_9VIRU